MVNEMRKQLTKISNSNYMKFVTNGKDEEVQEFLAEVISVRQLKKYVTKIISYLKSIDDIDRCEGYIAKQDEINTKWLGDVRNAANKQKNPLDKLELCDQGDDKYDRSYLASTMVVENEDHDEDESYNQSRKNVIYLKHALGKDQLNDDILKKLIMNLGSLYEHEKALKICKKSAVNDIAKSEILEYLLDLENYTEEFGERCMQVIIRLNPGHEYGNIDHYQRDTTTLSDESSEHSASLSGEYYPS
jgi:hypothetical protein